MVKAAERFERRARRTRFSLKASGHGRLRLSVHRSGRHIYGQVIDDEQGRTLAAASSLDKGLRTELKTGADREAARQVGLLLAERAKEAGAEVAVPDADILRVAPELARLLAAS